MTQRVADNDDIATFACRQHDWMERVLKGSLDPTEVARAVQVLIDRGQRTILTIDYGMSLKQMIVAGHYDWTNSDITEKRFPVEKSGSKVEVAVELIHFNRSISSEDATAEMGRRGLRPATIAELLVYGAKFGDDQRKFPIVALGSVAQVVGGRDVPFLYRCGSKRDLRLDWVGVVWDGYYRFLAVRN